jgi:putative ABC transport system permease protein
LAVVLLVGAGLLISSLARLNSVERGFEDESIVLATVDPALGRELTPEEVDAFYQEVLTRVRGLPGVVAASTTYSPPLVGNDFWTTVLPEGVDEETTDPFLAGLVIVRDGYFDANGVTLLRGRDFQPQDRLGEPLVAIVNETMAELFWPGEDAIGKRFAFTGGLRGSAESFDAAFFPDDLYTVVGIAEDVRRIDLAEETEPEYYRPQAQITWAFQYLVVRTNGNPLALGSQLRRAVWEVDTAVPVREVQALSQRVQRSLSPQRFRSFLLAAFAGVTAILAMVGLYALMSLMVARRSKEMGIRLALGARKSIILGGVMKRGMALVGAGLVVGIALSLAAGRVVAGMLFQIQSTDPVTYVVVGVLTISVACLACFLPARRAAEVDPIQTLQEE